MDVLTQHPPVGPRDRTLAPPRFAPDERAARRSLREQIAKLERDLGAAAIAAYPNVTMTGFAGGRAGPRLLDLGELESLRDELAERLYEVRQDVGAMAARQAEKRLLVERMLLDPARYKWVRVTGADVGEHVCKSWHVRPRLGLVGMLAGWWQVKVSSGCPLARGPRRAPRPRTSSH
jgi:hypothetical protein